MPPQLHPLANSAIITHYGYERGAEGKGALTVRFVGGDTWRYLQVPEDVIEGLLMSESRGSFVRREVVAKFHGERVE